MKRLILALTATAAVTTPAFAEYYIIQRPDQECEIVESVPEDTTILQVGPLAFGARDEAEREITVICNDEDDGERVIIERR